MLAKERANEMTKMKEVQLGLLLPHEVFGAMYHHANGAIFWRMMTGTPDDTGLCAVLNSNLGPPFILAPEPRA